VTHDGTTSEAPRENDMKRLGLALASEGGARTVVAGVWADSPAVRAAPGKPLTRGPLAAVNRAAAL
jgi:hypothetical protein